MIGCCLWFVVCCLRFATCCSLRVRGSVFVVCRGSSLLRVVSSLVFGVCYLLFVVVCSLLCVV